MSADLFDLPVTNTEPLVLTLPWPPSVNDFKIPHPKVRGMYFLTKRAKKFREDVQWLCVGVARFGTAEIAVEIDLHPPDVRKRDVDNWNKAVFDALQAAGVYDNDSQIQEYTVRKGAPSKGGAVVVKIRRFQC